MWDDPIKKDFTNSILISNAAGEGISSCWVMRLILSSEHVSFVRRESWDLENHGSPESL